MTNKIKIGIPKAFLYYRYNVLWKTFFESIGCTVVESCDTNKEILELGKSYSIDESCLASKIYMGHVAYLSDKCDYILVPRICDYGKGAKVCVKFNGIYDIVRNTFLFVKLIDYNIEKTKHESEFMGLFKLGLKFNKNPFKVLYAYHKAKVKERVNNNRLMTNQKILTKSKKAKILIIAHPYNIYDKYIGEPIVKFLKSMDIDILYADRLDRKIAVANSYELSQGLYWSYSRELIGALNYYKKVVDGVIFITAFPCGPDSLVNELLIRKVKNIPMANIIIDESTAEAGLHTRLESFVDIIKQKEHKDE